MPSRLNPHSAALLEEYRSRIQDYNALNESAKKALTDAIAEAGFIVAAVESRVKTESSLIGKLELKGEKYHSILDITDIVGIRVITFYNEDISKVASVIARYFKVDWDNFADKRKAREVDSFGYSSLHYICTLDSFPDIRFEIQIRTILQHAWANMNHDTGYKSGVEVPQRYLRQLSRLSGILELVDDEFSRIRTELTDYRRKVQSLVASGNLDEVALDGDSFKSYIQHRPFDRLNKRIASVNQAEIMDVPLFFLLPVFLGIGCNTLGDISRLLKDYEEAAFQLSTSQISLTDIDIISSSAGPQSLCIAYALKSGSGIPGVKHVLDLIYGESEGNLSVAEFFVDLCVGLPFMNSK